MTPTKEVAATEDRVLGIIQEASQCNFWDKLDGFPDFTLEGRLETPRFKIIAAKIDKFDACDIRSHQVTVFERTAGKASIYGTFYMPAERFRRTWDQIAQAVGLAA